MITALAAVLAIVVGAIYQRKTLNVAVSLDRSKRISEQNVAWASELRKELAEFCILVYDNGARCEVSRLQKQDYPRNSDDRNVQYEVEKSYHRLLLLLATARDASTLRGKVEALRKCHSSEWIDNRDALLAAAGELISRLLAEARA